ncbi:MAG: hypothetical protein IJW82_08095 [Clostridia bacterium]|nr:hypothetical protein [Clostridia bacterium]
MYRNYNNCCRPMNNCCNNRFMRGPRGATGPTGPRGAPGGSILADFINGATGEVEVDDLIPFSNNNNLSNGNITSTNGTNIVTLVNPGTYRVTYNANATSSGEGGLVGITATLNGGDITQSISEETPVGTDGVVNLGNSFLITTGPNATLSLVNSGENPTTYTNLNLIIEKIT